MKIVLSRKGFDSSAGGHVSPILPDGTLLSLRVPAPIDRLSPRTRGATAFPVEPERSGVRDRRERTHRPVGDAHHAKRHDDSTNSLLDEVVRVVEFERALGVAVRQIALLIAEFAMIV